MTKKISISLSQKSIQNAINEVRKYQRELIDKNELFVRRLAELGIPIIDQNIAAAQGDSDKSHNTYIKINSFGSYSEAKLVVEGSDLLFIEFGAGAYYNGSAGTSPHQKGKNLDIQSVLMEKDKAKMISGFIMLIPARRSCRMVQNQQCLFIKQAWK